MRCYLSCEMQEEIPLSQKNVGFRRRVFLPVILMGGFFALVANKKKKLDDDDELELSWWC